MRASTWVLRLGPPLVVAGLIAAGTAVLPMRSTGSASAASLRGCPGQTGFYAAVHSAPRAAGVAATVSLRSKLSSAGELVGRSLSIGSRQFDMATESFVAQPIGNVVVYGQNEPARGSTVRAVDLETSCDFGLWSSATDAVRSAVIDGSLGALYVHAVARSDRADRGVTRVDLASGAQTAAVAPLAAAEPFGLTFATKLQWSVGSDELAVQSCGIIACRTRVLDVASGGLTSYERPHGRLVGLTADRLFVFEPCDEAVCQLESVDRTTGVMASLGVAASAARLELRGGAAVLIAETSAGTKEIRP